jgi:hypothetical protein
LPLPDILKAIENRKFNLNEFIVWRPEPYSFWCSGQFWPISWCSLCFIKIPVWTLCCLC